MKKILIFSMAYYPHVGGAEVAIKEITDRVDDIEFHMVTLRFSSDEAAQEKIGNVLVYRIGSGARLWNKFFYQLQAAVVAKRMHKTHRYNGVWAIMAHSAGVPAALFSLLRPEVPFALTLQEGDPPEQIERTMLPLWPLFVQAFTRARVIQVISTFLGDWARRRGYLGPLEIIPNGVDAMRFAGEKVPHKDVVLITSSRLVHKNAVDDIIRALPLLPQDVRLRVLGVGPDEAMLRRLARELGVLERVEFVGFVDNAHLPQELHKADVFVRPSRSEGMGISFIEAFAARLPVVATQEGGLRDYITEAVAWPVPKNSPESIAAAVRAIQADPQNTARVVVNALRLVQDAYAWDRIARRMRERVFKPLFHD